jgi:hypothetical protein
MNNGQNNTNRNLLDTSRSNTNTNYQNYLNGAQRNLNSANQSDSELRGQIGSLYSDPNNFSVPGLTPNSNGWFNLPGGGSNAGADFSSAQKGYQGLADTGNASDFTDALSNYKGMASGNIGAANADNIRYRATAAVPSFYNNLKSTLASRSNTQGGYSPGFDSQMQEVARQQGRATYDASRQAEGDIADRSMQAAQFGTSGMANIANSISGNRVAGLGGLRDIANSQLGASEFNSGQNLGAQLSLANSYSNNRFGAAQGLSDLYKSAPGASGQANSNFLAGLNGMSQADLANLSARLGIKDNSWVNLIPGLVGAGGAALTGAGSVGFRV